MKKVLIVFGLMLILFISGCSSAIDKELLGQWEDTTLGIATSEFQEDGTIILDGLELIEGTYKTNGDALIVKTEAGDGEKKSTYSIDGNLLTITSGDGEVVEFERTGSTESASDENLETTGEAVVTEEDLAGEWQHTEYDVLFFEYNENGTFNFHNASGPDHYDTRKGTYEITGNKIINNFYNGDGGVEVTISIEGEILTLGDKDKDKYKRITKDIIKDYIAEKDLTPNPILASINNDKKALAKTIAKNRIVTGVWEFDDHYIEFKQDGTFYSMGVVRGLYKVDGDKLIFKEESEDEMKVSFSVEGDVLRMTNDVDETVEYTISTFESLNGYLSESN